MLIAEDEDQDVQILKLACERARVSLPMHFVRDGEEVRDYLKGQGPFADRSTYPLPRLLLLDVNMPRLSGFGVLEWLRLQPGLRRLVVIIFTSSDLPQDIARAFDLGANSYLVKPSDFSKLEETVRYLQGYWLNLNRCPDCAGILSTPTDQLRILLRNPETRQYFCEPGTWTHDPNAALGFEATERASQAALRMNLTSFEVVVQPSPN